MDDYVVRLRLRTYLEDGLLEICLAAALATLSAWFLLEELVYMAWMLPWLFITVILPSAKRKMAEPRGGVSDFPKPGGRRRLVAMIVLGLSVLALFGLVVATAASRDAAWFRPIEAVISFMASHLPLTLGSTMTIVLAKLGIRGMTPRLVVLAGLCLIAGLVADILVPGVRRATLIMGCSAGVPIMLSGYLTFRRFMRTHPPVQEPMGA